MLLLDWAPVGRMKYVAVSLDILSNLFTVGSTMEMRCIQGLPENCQRERMIVTPEALFIVYSHPSWPLVAGGHPIPDLMVEMADLHPTSGVPRAERRKIDRTMARIKAPRVVVPPNPAAN